MIVTLPEEVLHIIDTLESAGYEAYVTGVCVRETLLDFEVNDWEICTSALPDEVKKCFPDQKRCKITTCRREGVYPDNYHPEKVEFLADLKMEMSRRDFTINAVAYNPKNGMSDFYGGFHDITNGIIKCVGDSGKRFQEDPLRIIQALRLSSVLGFYINEYTKKAMVNNRHLLKSVAEEQLEQEYSGLLAGKAAKRVLADNSDVLNELFP